jgi:hypothetical protein
MFNLDLHRGEPGRWQFKLWADSDKTRPIDLADATIDAIIRDRTGRLRFALDCTVTLPNIVEMELTDARSRNLPTEGTWKLQLTYPGGNIELKGAVYVVAPKLAMVK